ncbi:MAG: helix-turn-helix domain-containing protein, partial [Microbacterium sp.]|nr:helix-turn-helix domain-containing protein [Microbacterium sp.]
SERETEVLRLYAGGQTADLVAAALFISRDTVNDHIRRIRAKYAAAGRPAPTKVDLFKRAVEDGLV